MSDRWCWFPLLFPMLASAQADSTWSPHMVHGHRITVEAVGGYDSNVLYNDLVMGIYRGGFLSEDVRERSMAALGSTNRAGYELGGKATLAWGDSLFGSPRLMPRFSLAHRDLLGVRFARDAFTLSFFGNAAFEGSTAHIGPSAFEQVQYQTIAFGVEDRRTGSFVELAVVNGRTLNAGDIPKADLLTATDGRYLELELDGNYQRSDTGRTGFSNGIGAAITLQWKRPFRLLGMPVTGSVGISDLGFISWNKRPLSVDKDSTIRYEGFEVAGILDLDGLILNEHTLQDSLGLGYEQKRFLRPLPAMMEAKLEFGRLHKGIPGFERHAYAVSIEHRTLPGYIPRGTVVRNFVISRAVLAQVGATYGGFGEFRVRLGFEAFVMDHLCIGVGTPNAVGLFSDQARGKALAARVEVVW